MIRICYKTTVWVDLYINDDKITEEEVVEILKSTEDVNELYSLTDNCETNTLYESEEQLTVEENQGCSTIEVYTTEAKDKMAKDKMVWQNGK